MSKLLTPNFIRENGLAALTERYAITAKRHGEFPNLVFLKYSQTESRMDEPIVQECRGLILDEADDWRVVSFPFKKFFNHGEPNAAAVDWSSARVYEKLDGSLMTLYWYRDQWRVASNGTPDAGGEVNGYGFTFAQLFWRVWRENGYVMPWDRKLCYVWELMTPYNRVVVQHEKPRLCLIGARLVPTLAEQDVSAVADENHYPYVQSYPLGSIADVIAAADKLDPLCNEGYVVCDANFNRVKVKCPQYVALSHLKETASPRRFLEVIRSGESAEFLAYFPELKDGYDKIRDRFDKLCADVDFIYAGMKDIPVQKDFARAALLAQDSAALFSIRKGHAKSARDYYSKCTQSAAERALGLDAREVLAA